jgi:hypothetical protein
MEAPTRPSQLAPTSAKGGNECSEHGGATREMEKEKNRNREKKDFEVSRFHRSAHSSVGRPSFLLFNPLTIESTNQRDRHCSRREGNFRRHHE